MSDNQFMLHVMNNPTSDYNNQVNNKMEQRLGKTIDPLPTEDMSDELGLRYEGINKKDDSDEEEGEHTVKIKFLSHTHPAQGVWRNLAFTLSYCIQNVSFGARYWVGVVTLT